MKFWQVLVLILFIAALAVGISVWQPWRTSNRQIEVSAEGKVKATPDVSKLSAGIEVKKDNAKDAQTEATKVMDKIIAAAKEKGVAQKDIQTQNISTYPNYDYSSTSGSRISGYYGRGVVTITVREVAKAQEVLDAVSAAGANSVYGPQLTFSDEKLAELQTQARTVAIQNAKKKADELAKAGNTKVGKLLSVREQSTDRYYPVFAAESAADLKGMGGSANAITPGENDVTVSVGVSYALE